ncbi:hypothetical protein JTE90_024748 [Oedothorax gibbosus]|uniref:Peptidase aspartic putative domain-containing protein n=1 Tax=Oedothorax gibbosus TaxID=931172 RepID=A0AAV6UAD8_9ARAC|nr:hypothetical protein JTE90_024748 [Oedothorax gibbosus]
MSLPSRTESYNFYFQSLERAFQIKNVPETFKAEILLNILGEKAANMMVHMTADDLSDYSKVKEAVLKEFQSSPQDVLNDFRGAQIFRDETYVQFASRLSATLDYYCQLREVNDFKGLCDLVVSDKLFSTLYRDLQLHIGVKQEDNWFKPHDMSKCIDIYVSSSGNGKTEPVSHSRGSVNETNKGNRLNGPKLASKSFVSEVKGPKCVLCKNATHFLNLCPELKKILVKERVEVVKANKLCFNCFGNHKVTTCWSKLSCGVCKKRHHIYLHFPEVSDESGPSESGGNRVTQVAASFNPSAQVFIPKETNDQTEVKFYAAANTSKVGSKIVLLSTATVQVADKFGRYHSARALLDNGSQSCFIAQPYAKKLDLRRNKIRVVVSGLNNPTSVVDTAIKTTIANHDAKIVKLLVVPNITDFAPTQYFDISTLDLGHVKLADDNFNRPG